MTERKERLPYRVDKPIELQELPDRLIELRKHFGLTPMEAFRACFGKKGATWSNWESGVAIPPLRAIIQIINYWGINPSWLVMGDGEMLNHG